MMKMENDFTFNLGSLKIVQIGYIYRDIKKQIERLEKVVISSAAFIIIGLFTLLLTLLKYHF